jgi:DNA-binding NarL/FixJ family response regulator
VATDQDGSHLNNREASDGVEAIAAAEATRLDVILMDIRMPAMDGITAMRHILDTVEPPPKVIVLTTFDVDEYVYAALRAGASGFLLKETEPTRLLDAIHTAASGEMLFAPTVTRRLVENYVNSHPEPERTPPTRRSTRSPHASWRSSNWSGRACRTRRSPPGSR